MDTGGHSRGLARWALATLAAGTALSGCSGSGSPSSLPTVTAPSPASTSVPAFYRVPSPLPAGNPGSLIRAEMVSRVPGVPAGARVWRILYRSTGDRGQVAGVSGYVVAPAGAPPVGGFRVVAWDHGTTGMAPPCAPSLFTDLDGQQEYLAPYLASFLAAGDVVVAPDYQGLGAGTLHPYLDGDIEAYDTLDAVRAASHLPGLRLGPDIVVIGHSQGGQAALFTGQVAAAYAPDLHALGVVAIAPATNLTVAVQAAPALSSAGGITHGQGELDFVAMALWGWTHTYAGQSPATVFTPAGVEAMASAGTGCLPQIAIALHGMTAAMLFRPGALTSAAVKRDAAVNDPGHAPIGAPVLIVQGTGDQTVPWQLTQYFVSHQACPVGDRVQLTLRAGLTHSGVIGPARSQILRWMGDRFAGRPAPDGCPKAAPAG